MFQTDISIDEVGTRDSVLDIIGRERTVRDTIVYEDWLLVNFNGYTCKVGAGFFGRVDEGFKLPEKAIIRHMVIDKRSRDERLRFPIFIGFKH
jgi:hypothetical protein